MKGYFPDKAYSEMTRREKRAYNRWLCKNRLWDSEVVIENQMKMGKLIIHQDNSNKGYGTKEKT